MHIRSLILLALFTTIAAIAFADGPTTRLTTHPADPSLRDLCQVRFEDGRLVIHSPRAATGRVMDNNLPIWDLPGDSNVRIFSTPGDDRPNVFQLINTNIRVPGTTMVQTQITLQGQTLIIHQHVQTAVGWRIVSLVQGESSANGGLMKLLGGGSERRISLMIMRSEDGQNNTITSADWPALRREHPHEVDQYLRPLLKWLRQDALFGVEPMVAWQVFADEWQPDAQLAARVSGLAAALGAERFTDRLAAEEQLVKEGVPAALCLTRLSREGLPLEARGRLDAFLSKYACVDTAERARLARDPEFLLDCLYSDDAAVRAVGLRRLNAEIHRTIDLAGKTEPQRLAIIEELREELVPRAALRLPVEGDPK